MLSNILAIALATLATQAQAQKNVFAHFIVGLVVTWLRNPILKLNLGRQRQWQQRCH